MSDSEFSGESMSDVDDSFVFIFVIGIGVSFHDCLLSQMSRHSLEPLLHI